MSDVTEATNAQATNAQVTNAQVTNAKVAECIDMAIKARVNARSAQSPGDRGFWQIMEERWIHLAQTYRETERLTHSLL